MVRGSVVKEETYDNQDSSVNIVYVVKPETVAIQQGHVAPQPPPEDDFRIEAPPEKEEISVGQIPF